MNMARGKEMSRINVDSDTVQMLNEASIQLGTKSVKGTAGRPGLTQHAATIRALIKRTTISRVSLIPDRQVSSVCDMCVCVCVNVYVWMCAHVCTVAVVYLSL